jgi:hypothetical protein
MYLGDGMISTHRRNVYRLRIFLDRAYPLIVAECEAAMSIVLPASKASTYRHKHDRVNEVSSFPNTAPGSSTSGESFWSLGSGASLSAIPVACSAA